MFCGKCGAEIKSNQKFCSKCGTAVSNNIIETNIGTKSDTNKPNRSSKKVKKIIVVIVCVVLAIAIAITGKTFLHNKDNENSNDEVNNTTTNSFEETTEETIKYLDFYENSLDWCGEYGFSAMKNFTYNVNGIYQNVSDDNLGILSAVEYDCDNDGNNELITLSLLPTNDKKLFLSPSIVTNKNEIKKYELLDYSSDKLASRCPVFDIGNIESQWSSFISTRAFISDNKLCILHGMSSVAEVGRGESFDSIYIYNLSTTGVDLYRHYYLYEEEKVENYRNCSVGESTQGWNYFLDMDYDYNNTPNWLSVNQTELKQWKELVKTAVTEMREDASEYNFDKHFTTREELDQALGSLLIINPNIFKDDYFVGNELMLDVYFECEKGNYTADTITDYTKIRGKIS